MGSRDYQLRVMQDNREAWAAGHQNVLMLMPTGAGKTHVVGRHVVEEPGMSLLMAHRQELVGQLALQLAREKVYHDVLAPKAVRQDIVRAQMELYGRSYVASGANAWVAGVNTLGRRGPMPWSRDVKLVVPDESHHYLAKNVYGQALTSSAPNARGLFPTASPCRADGAGLGRHADGLADVMTRGPTQRWLIDNGFLSPYRLVCPADSIQGDIKISASTGDFSQAALREAAHESRIVGDGIAHYLKWTPGLLCIAYTVDVASATEAASRFRAAGVPAEVISAGTPTSLRAHLMRQFRSRKILVLVNCDTLSEGVDVPGCEVVLDMAPTRSWGRYCLDPETEVLTPDGWVRSDQAAAAAEVIAFDPESGETRRSAVRSFVQRPLYPDERMYAVKSQHLDLLVSDKHRLLVRSTSRTAKAWQFENAEDVALRRGHSQLPVAGVCSRPASGLTDAELHFLGWFLSDGHLNPKNNSVAIGQAVNKTEHIAHIRAALTGCGFRFGEYILRRKNVPETHHDLRVFNISRGMPLRRSTPGTGWERLEAWIDKSLPEVYDTLNAQDLTTLLEAWNLGDGRNNLSSISDYEVGSMAIHCGTNRRMADRLQQLCIERGKRCNITEFSPNGRPLFRAFIKDVLTSSLPGTNVADGAVSGKKPYSRSRLAPSDERPDFVWCLETELGTLITRRRGKVVFMGNCQRFGRMLRLSDGKERGWYLDPAGNVARNGGPPDWRVHFTLDASEGRGKGEPALGRRCRNEACLQYFPRELKACPYCNEAIPGPGARGGPDLVDGDLTEVDPAWLEAKAREIAAIHGEPVLPHGIGQKARVGAYNRHTERRKEHESLRHTADVWAALQDVPLDVAYRRFYLTFDVDMATAQALPRREAEELRQRIEARIVADGYVINREEAVR